MDRELGFAGGHGHLPLCRQRRTVLGPYLHSPERRHPVAHDLPAPHRPQQQFHLAFRGPFGTGRVYEHRAGLVSGQDGRAQRMQGHRRPRGDGCDGHPQLQQRQPGVPPGRPLLRGAVVYQRRLHGQPGRQAALQDPSGNAQKRPDGEFILRVARPCAVHRVDARFPVRTPHQETLPDSALLHNRRHLFLLRMGHRCQEQFLPVLAYALCRRTVPVFAGCRAYHQHDHTGCASARARYA